MNLPQITQITQKRKRAKRVVDSTAEPILTLILV